MIRIRKIVVIAIVVLCATSNSKSMGRVLQGARAVAQNAGVLAQSDAMQKTFKFVKKMGDKVSDRMEKRALAAAADHQRQLDECDVHITGYKAATTPEAEKQAWIAKKIRLMSEGEEEQKKYRELGFKVTDAAFNIGNTVLTGYANEEAKRGDREHEENIANTEGFWKSDAAVKKAKESATATANAWIEFINRDPHKKLGFLFAAVAGVYAIAHGSAYVAEALKIPSLAQETSLLSITERLKNWIAGTTPPESALSDVVLEPVLAERVQEISQSLSLTVQNGAFLPNLLFWGPPGTGKTMIALRMARSCGLHYIYFSASMLDQYPVEEAIKKLTELFTFAQNSNQKLMIVVDEAEVLFADRGKNLTDKTRKLLTHLLTFTGTESRNYMMVLLTNRPEDLDEAVLSRCDQRIEIGTPAPAQRRSILDMYVNKYLFNANQLQPSKPFWSGWFGSEEEMKQVTIAEDVFTPEEIDSISGKLNGFVGRDISKLVLQILTSTYATEECKVTKEIVDRVVTTKIREKSAQTEGFKRTTHGTAAAAA